MAIVEWDSGDFTITNDGKTATHNWQDGDAYHCAESGEKTAGKWYFECTLNKGTYPGDNSCAMVGWAESAYSNTTNFGAKSTATDCSYGTTVDKDFDSDIQTIVGIAIDIDTGKLWFSINGTWSGDPGAGTDEEINTTLPASVCPIIRAYSGDDVWEAAFAEEDFAYTAPTGFDPVGDDAPAVPAVEASISGQVTFSGTFSAGSEGMAAMAGSIVFDGDIHAVSYGQNDIVGVLTLSGNMAAHSEGRASILGALSLNGSFIATAPTDANILGLLSLDGSMSAITHDSYMIGSFGLSGAMDAMTDGLCDMSGVLSFAGVMSATSAHSLALPAHSLSRWS